MLTLEFRSLSYKYPAVVVNGRWKRHTSKVLVASYAFPFSLTTPFVFPNEKVRGAFSTRTAKNWIDSSKRDPECWVNVADSMADKVDVWLSPIKDGETPRPLKLLMFDGWNRIYADVFSDDYAYFRSLARNGELQEPEFMQEIQIKLGRESPVMDEFGFAVPIIALSSRVPVIEAILNEARPSEEELPAFLRRKSDSRTPSQNSRSREERLQSFLESLNSLDS